MNVGCEQALERLWPLTEPGEMDSPELVEAREHLRRCSACQAYFRRDATLGRRLRDLKTNGLKVLPEACRAELLMQLSGDAQISDPDIEPIESKQPRRGRSWQEWLATAAAITLLAGGLAISHSIESPLSDGAFTADFMHANLPEIETDNVTATQVASFYAEQFGDQMNPARLLDARVTRVAVCIVEGRRGAMVEYDLGGERLVYYQIPLDGGRTTRDLRTGTEGDLNVARWGDDLSEHVLVSAIPLEHLEEYARQRLTSF